ncbi:MAG: hypothetical protein RMX68_011360 [Aulosira sp. ZfuVER01]|nr:hypothetical protein [Aulosira sp. ZfuVER01]MDZ7996946.1 hypothetical protein [Aulosira sp. DedVER01a]MDZ8050565.1 hypothetical protein [Aulosira sp. ZfuCHP01]
MQPTYAGATFYFLIFVDEHSLLCNKPTPVRIPTAVPSSRQSRPTDCLPAEATGLAEGRQREQMTNAQSPIS